MTITEAKIIVDKALIDGDQYFSLQELKALLMARSALDQFVAWRAGPVRYVFEPLEGETNVGLPNMEP